MLRMTWSEICQSEDLRGRWIALDDCSFDESTGHAMEGLVVDSDDDLAELVDAVRDQSAHLVSVPDVATLKLRQRHVTAIDVV